jgi:hypothetical protein
MLKLVVVVLVLVQAPAEFRAERQSAVDFRDKLTHQPNLGKQSIRQQARASVEWFSDLAALPG